jgi:hypothetical protein
VLGEISDYLDGNWDPLVPLFVDVLKEIVSGSAIRRCSRRRTMDTLCWEVIFLRTIVFKCCDTVVSVFVVV